MSKGEFMTSGRQCDLVGQLRIGSEVWWQAYMKESFCEMHGALCAHMGFAGMGARHGSHV